MSTRTYINVDTSVSSAQPGHVTGTNVTNGSHKLGMDVAVIDGLERIHTRTHQGRVYHLSSLSTIASGETSNFLFDLTVSGSNIHCGFHADVSGECRFELFENATVTANGTTMTAINTNRASANSVTGHRFYKGATISNNGSTLTSLYIPGGSGGNAQGGAGGAIPRAGAEWILSTSKKYLFTITNLGALPITAGMCSTFYEN